MNHPIRVLFLIGELTVAGGSESHLEQLITNLDKKKFTLEMSVFCGKGARAKRIQASGVPVYDLGIGEDSQPVLSYDRNQENAVTNRKDSFINQLHQTRHRPLLRFYLRFSLCCAHVLPTGRSNHNHSSGETALPTQALALQDNEPSS